MAITQLPISQLLPLAIAIGIAIALAVVVAPQLADLLIRFRVSRLPEDLAHRYSEEWIAEVRSMSNRLRKLTFAIAISVMRSKTLVDAEKQLPEAAAPVVLSIEDVRVYSEFSSRLGARLIDFFCMWMAVAILSIALQGSMERAGIALVSTNLLLLVEMWFILRFGGTPGKLAMNLSIITFRGEALTYRHVLFRLLPDYALSVVSYGMSLWAIHHVAGASFDALPSAEQQRLIAAAIPTSLAASLFACRLTWILADIAVFFHSAERRALHDVIAGTVVVVNVPRVIGSLDDNPPVGSTSAYR